MESQIASTPSRELTMKRKRRYALLVVTSGGAMFAVLCGAIIGSGLKDDVRSADVAVVFGNKVNPDGQPSPRLKARLERSLELYRQGVCAHVVVSGAVGKEGFDEAVAMKEYLVERGVPHDRVIADSEGFTTSATAVNLARLMKQHGWSCAIVVSQYFHIARCRLALRQAGIAEVFSAHARHFELRDLYSIPREVVAYASYYMKTYNVRRKGKSAAD